jgi:hypothetical protein
MKLPHILRNVNVPTFALIIERMGMAEARNSPIICNVHLVSN